jgi:hypothetical protein
MAGRCYPAVFHPRAPPSDWGTGCSVLRSNCRSPVHIFRSKHFWAIQGAILLPSTRSPWTSGGRIFSWHRPPAEVKRSALVLSRVCIGEGESRRQRKMCDVDLSAECVLRLSTRSIFHNRTKKLYIWTPQFSSIKCFTPLKI